MQRRTVASACALRRTTGRALAVLVVSVFGPGRVFAQRDTTPVTLPAVEVTVTRDAARSPLDLPYAISVLRPDTLRPGQRHLGLDETLLGVPGVAVANRYNPTQDPRVSIRGFGARSAFGVRGVRVLRDGIPLTLPDGQTPVDYLDLESVGHVEVIRGSAAALYGNAAGGVIDLRSAPPPDAIVAVQGRGWGGSHGLKRFVGGAGGSAGALRYQATIGRTENDGYRSYARQRTTNAFGRLMLHSVGTDWALHLLALDMPTAENPGSLTEAEFTSDPRLADPLAVRKGARKAVQQLQLALTASRPVLGGELSAAFFGGRRALENPLAFAIVDLDRASYGASLRGTFAGRAAGTSHRVSLGIDAQRQDDDRREFENCNDSPPLVVMTATCPVVGAERGTIRRNQRELVSGVGPFVRVESEITRRLGLSAGVRADYVRFTVQDRLVTERNPDDSGERTLRAVSPMAGAVARLTPLASLYVTASSAFETPTATELGNKPDGSAGVNPELKPQRATTYEAGLKGFLFDRLRYDVAAFRTRVRDELIPFEIPGGAGRRFFRNAGRTGRRGIEVGLAAALGVFAVGGAYSYADFTFADFTVGSADYSGNRIPGIPIQQAQASATWRVRDLFATVEGITSGAVFVDDANGARAAAFGVLNLRVGGTASLGATRVSPVLAIQNVFDRRYAGSVSVNAAGGRYYEPAPGRTVAIGVTVTAKTNE